MLNLSYIIIKVKPSLKGNIIYKTIYRLLSIIIVRNCVDAKNGCWFSDILILIDLSIYIICIHFLDKYQA